MIKPVQIASLGLKVLRPWVLNCCIYMFGRRGSSVCLLVPGKGNSGLQKRSPTSTSSWDNLVPIQPPKDTWALSNTPTNTPEHKVVMRPALRVFSQPTNHEMLYPLPCRGPELRTPHTTRRNLVQVEFITSVDYRVHSSSCLYFSPVPWRFSQLAESHQMER